MLFTSGDGYLNAVDRNGGHLQWRVAIGRDTAPRWGFEYIASSPTIDNGVVYVGGADGRLHAVQAATGKLLWKSEPLGGKAIPSPAVSGNRVFIASDSGKVYAFDRHGAPLWTFETDGVHNDSEKAGYDRRAINASPAVAGDTVVVGARDGIFYAIGAADGKERWRYDNHLFWVIASAALWQGRAYVGTSDGKDFQAFDLAGGRKVWDVVLPSRIFSSAAMAGGVLYFGDEDGGLHGLAAEDGHEVARYWIGAPITSSPSIHGEAMYVGADDGKLYAFRSGAPAPVAHRALFWQDEHPLRFHEGVRLRDYARTAGYDVVDGAKLAAFVEARIADREPSVVIFANDRVPKELGADPASGTLFSRYLSSGGRVVWLGIAPYAVTFDPSTGRPAGMDFARSAAFLGVPFAPFPGDDLPARATDEGRRRGLPPWWISSGGIEAKGMDEILARDDYGRAVTWIKRVGAGEFFMIGAGETIGFDPAVLIRLAESREP